MNDDMTITLNDYQRRNLLWLLKIIHEMSVPPFGAANTGDWCGEIRWMLGGDLKEGETANETEAGLKQRIEWWLESKAKP